MEPRHDGLVPFFAAAFGLTWLCFGAVAAAGIPAASALGRPLILLGVFAPALAAAWQTSRRKGTAGLRALLGGALRANVDLPYWALALGFMAAVKLAVAVVHRAVVGAWPRFGLEPWYVILGATIVSMPFQTGEEVGWRGFALPRLADRIGLRGASLVLGAIWALWHLPQFFIPEADTYRQSFPVFALQVTALSVALAWVYARTEGSLLIVMLMHAAVNNTKDIVPSASPRAADALSFQASTVAWLTVAVLWICAGAFLATMPKRLPAAARSAEVPDGSANQLRPRNAGAPSLGPPSR